MELDAFERLLRSRNAVFLTDELVLFTDLELYDNRTEQSQHYRNMQELYAQPMQGKTIGDYIRSQESFDRTLDGGRGASSLSGKMGGGFTSASDDGSGGLKNMLFPATFNVGGRFRSYDKVLNQFQRRYRARITNTALRWTQAVLCIGTSRAGVPRWRYTAQEDRCYCTIIPAAGISAKPTCK